MARPMRFRIVCAYVAALGLFVALGVAALGEPAWAGERQGSAHGTLVRLSDERTITRWATPLRTARIYAAPSASARAAGKLRFLTEDRMPEVYIALTLATNSEGSWVRIRIPGRPNGRLGWVRRSSFGDLVRNEFRLVVNRRSLHVRLFRAGKQIFRARIGIGAARTPTPGGRFWIREKLRFARNPLYGRYALGTSAYAPTLSEWPGGGVVGIHGTSSPSLIPGRPSHGCVRVRNAAMAKLWRMTPLGTPLRIL